MTRIIRREDGMELASDEAKKYPDDEIRVEKFCPVKGEWTDQLHGCGWSNNGQAFCAGPNGWDDAQC